MTFVRKRQNILRELPINPYVNVLIDVKSWEPVGLVPGGWELRSPTNPTERKILFRHEFEDLQKAGRVHIVDNVTSFSKRLNISHADRDTTVLRFFWATAVDDCIAEGLIRGTPKGHDFEKVIAAKAQSVIAAFQAYRTSDEVDHGEVQRKAYGGAISPSRSRGPADIDPERLKFDPKTLKRHYSKWCEKGDLWDLRPKSRSHDRGGPKPDPKTVEFIKNHITSYDSEIVSNVSGLLEYVNAFIEDANMVRGGDAQIPLATYYSVAQAIDELPAYRIIGGRQGKKAARQVLRHVGAGPSYKRPGEMVLFDCWSTHVHLLLDKKVQALFSTEKNAQRIVLSVGFDSASDTFVALDASLTENSQLTQRTLRMALSDKSAIAEEAGCTASWHMRLAAEEGKSDCGGAYRNQLFLSAAMAIFDRYTYAAAGRAHLRGKVERILRTMDTKFVRKYLRPVGRGATSLRRASTTQRSGLSSSSRTFCG
jgi:hypothetical protein